MINLNVIDMMAFKQFKETQREDEVYGQYLRSLADHQLQSEKDHLLRLESSSLDFFSRARVLLKEISSRAHPSVKRKIDALVDENLKKH